jgi:hypothetical protein
VSLENGDSISVRSDDGFRILIDGNPFSEFVGLRGPKLGGHNERSRFKNRA